MSGMARVRELVGWRLDASPYREAWAREAQVDVEREADRAQEFVSRAGVWHGGSALVPEESDRLEELFAEQRERPDLRREMAGLRWSLGVVDLRRLIAFQRRVVFDDRGAADGVHGAPDGLRGAADGSGGAAELPLETDWDDLVALAFGRPREVVYSVVADGDGCGFELRSSNPDLQIRFREGAQGAAPIELYGGSPFFEVAEYRGRWFLRDGYHRAYALMRAGIWQMPAVIVRARSMEELGATRPWFFSEAMLFSERPPMVTDFLCGDACLEYERPRLVKRVRIVVEESVCEETEPELGFGPELGDRSGDDKGNSRFLRCAPE